MDSQQNYPKRFFDGFRHFYMSCFQKKKVYQNLPRGKCLNHHFSKMATSHQTLLFNDNIFTNIHHLSLFFQLQSIFQALYMQFFMLFLTTQFTIFCADKYSIYTENSQFLQRICLIVKKYFIQTLHTTHYKIICIFGNFNIHKMVVQIHSSL